MLSEGYHADFFYHLDNLSNLSNKDQFPIVFFPLFKTTNFNVFYHTLLK